MGRGTFKKAIVEPTVNEADGFGQHGEQGLFLLHNVEKTVQAENL